MVFVELVVEDKVLGVLGLDVSIVLLISTVSVELVIEDEELGDGLEERVFVEVNELELDDDTMLAVYTVFVEIMLVIVRREEDMQLESEAEVQVTIPLQPDTNGQTVHVLGVPVVL